MLNRFYRGGPMNLARLTNEELLQSTELAAQNEREATTRLLHHLCELQRRRLFALSGCSSLFDYCVRVLKMSEPQAARRVNAARMLKEFPEIEEKIQSGALSLTAVSQAQVFFRKEATASRKEKAGILRELENQPSRKAEKILLSHSAHPEVPKKERVRAVTETLSELRLTLDQETMDDLDRLREIWSHRMPGASVAELVKAMAAYCRQKLDPDLRAEPKRRSSARAQVPAPASAPTPAPELGRSIPGRLRRAVWKRDKGCCTYRDPETLRHCGSRYQLEIDHITPFARGGKTTAENLRLRCHAHNQWHAIEAYGPGVMKYAAS
jgi:hypothetical protein